MFFRSSRIRTLVAMVTNSSYRLIVGKEFLFHFGSYLEFFLIEMLIEQFSTFHTTFFQISEIDWLSVLQKG